MQVENIKSHIHTIDDDNNSMDGNIYCVEKHSIAGSHLSSSATILITLASIPVEYRIVFKFYPPTLKCL